MTDRPSQGIRTPVNPDQRSRPRLPWAWKLEHEELWILLLTASPLLVGILIYVILLALRFFGAR